MAITIKVNGTALPGEVVEIERGDELLWSDGTGRGAVNGLLVGSVVAAKQTWQIRWGVVTQAQNDAIRAIPQGFFTLLVQDEPSNIEDEPSILAYLSAYRSNITGSHVGTLGGASYWKDVEVQLIER